MGKRFGAIALTAGVAGGGVIGALWGVPMVSGAQTDTSTSTMAPADGTAKADGHRGPGFAADGGPLTRALDTLVKNKTITQPQADAVKTEVRKEVPARPGGEFKKDLMVTAAETLGMTPEALRTELQAGKTLATIAGERNVAVDTLIDALVDKANSQIDQAAADGKITQERATEMKSKTEDRITKMVNEGRRQGNRGPRGAEVPAGADA